ncbi:carbonic anhydrase family protein [Roseateles oligotrophus]|nr:carbonic anhydrase family protein [Roseateles oligotrophus]
MLALLITLGLGAAQASDDHGGPVHPKPYTPGVTLSKAVQASITPEQSIKILQAGNQRFAAGRSLKYDHKRHVRQTALGQFPFASVVACIDSRSAPEQVFDTGVGDIFTARVAGSTVNEDMVGSLEYAAKVGGSRAIVVLGHSNCGAIKGACDDVQMGNLTGLLAKLKPAVEATSTSGERNSKNYSFVNDVNEMNVKLTVEKIRATSPILKEMEAAGQIKIVGAVYDTATGKVHWQ